MTLLRHVLLFFVFSTIGSVANAQEKGEQISYKLTDIRVDDPDLMIGAGLGLYMPGFAGYELFAMANELIIPNLWGDFRYVQSTGISNDTTTLGDGSEIKLRGGMVI